MVFLLVVMGARGHAGWVITLVGEKDHLEKAWTREGSRLLLMGGMTKGIKIITNGRRSIPRLGVKRARLLLMGGGMSLGWGSSGQDYY